MQWDSSLECGVELIDNEHKELFKMVSNLMKGTNKNHFKETSEKTLNFLGEYVVNHFAHEEELMEKSGYPYMQEHAELHAKFVVTFQNLKKKFENSGDSMKIAIEIKHAAMSWLVNHIKVIDQRFTNYYIDTI